ncbi:hypothetical protein LC087_04015 [Bacillus carboniphilus]|uniref:Spore germination protein n=1 Tax=Bacillus carboniphilus TaxID=86663 RepID=A0ABY9JX49_9BACI|nr:hypothetical protein [Bacillus carboniphilus]WLR43358.1 hypothetical protein LC087_04015 [Bacillus carboniphilus]
MFSPMILNIIGFKVNLVDEQSSINLGPSIQADKFNSSKRTQGFGETSGDLSPVYIPINFVADPDVVDSNAVKNSFI